jgi:hypothetical protein
VSKLYIPTLILLVLALVPADADANGRRHMRADLEGFQEVPAISTAADGEFEAVLSHDGEEIEYELSYEDLEGAVAQSHLHLGQHSVNGGISIFLCTNLGNGPPGTQLCPPSPATISGTLSDADVLGPTVQGIQPGEWDEVRLAIEEDVVYVNVHTDLFPAGEIRGQVRGDQGLNLP